MFTLHPTSVYKWYLSQNKDVLNLGINPVAHWLKYGRFEGRSILIPSWYKKRVLNNPFILKELNKLDKIAEGDFYYLIQAYTNNNQIENIEIHRFHSYKNQIIKYLLYKSMLTLFKYNLSISEINFKINIFLKTYNFINSILLKSKLIFYYNSLDTRIKKTDTDVLIALLLTIPTIKIENIGNINDTQINSLVRWKYGEAGE